MKKYIACSVQCDGGWKYLGGLGHFEESEEQYRPLIEKELQDSSDSGKEMLRVRYELWIEDNDYREHCFDIWRIRSEWEDGETGVVTRDEDFFTTPDAALEHLLVMGLTALDVTRFVHLCSYGEYCCVLPRRKHDPD